MDGQHNPALCLGCRCELPAGATGMCLSCRNEREKGWRTQRPVHERMKARYEARDADPLRVVQCPLCTRRFFTEEHQRQHYADRHMVRIDV